MQRSLEYKRLYSERFCLPEHVSHDVHCLSYSQDYSDNSFGSDLSDNDVELPKTPNGSSRNGPRTKSAKTIKKPRKHLEVVRVVANFLFELQRMFFFPFF